MSISTSTLGMPIRRPEPGASSMSFDSYTPSAFNTHIGTTFGSLSKTTGAGASITFWLRRRWLPGAGKATSISRPVKQREHPTIPWSGPSFPEWDGPDLAQQSPPLVIRDATEVDMEAVGQIYAFHVLHGLATFEEVPPVPGEMLSRCEAVLKAGLPYLVATLDGQVVGYAYATIYRPRPAY